LEGLPSDLGSGGGRAEACFGREGRKGSMRMGSPFSETWPREDRSSLRSDGCRRAGEEGFALRHTVWRFEQMEFAPVARLQTGSERKGLLFLEGSGGSGKRGSPRISGREEGGKDRELAFGFDLSSRKGGSGLASDRRPRRRSFPGKLAFPKERQAGEDRASARFKPDQGERGEPRFPERAWGRWRKKLRFLFKPASSKRERRAQASWRQLRKRGTGI